MSTLWGSSEYHIIRECSHRTMQACRQKHIAFLDIRKRDLRKKRHPISPLFEAYLAFAATLGESLMSHTSWTGMLAPGLLAALETANSAAGLDGAQAHRCLLRHAKPFCSSHQGPIQNSVEAPARDTGREQPSPLQLHNTSRPHAASPHNGTCAHGHSPVH